MQKVSMFIVCCTHMHAHTVNGYIQEHHNMHISERIYVYMVPVLLLIKKLQFHQRKDILEATRSLIREPPNFIFCNHCTISYFRFGKIYTKQTTKHFNPIQFNTVQGYYEEN